MLTAPGRRLPFCVALSAIFLESFAAWAWSASHAQQEQRELSAEEASATGRQAPDGVLWSEAAAASANSESGSLNAQQEDQQQQKQREQTQQQQQQQQQGHLGVAELRGVGRDPSEEHRLLQPWRPALMASKYELLASPGSAVDWTANVKALQSAASPVEWNFLFLFLTMLIVLDVVFMQTLPDHARMHLAMLLFWGVVAAAYGAQVCGRLGGDAAIQWAQGFFLELCYSVESIVAFFWVFTSLATPERLLAKVMFVGLVCAIGCRFLLYLGLAAQLRNFLVVPYIVGLGMLAVGTKQLLAPSEDADVAESLLARSAKRVLGMSLVDYYDEEREAVFVHDGGRWRMTLLGVAMCGVVLADFLLSWSTVLAKQEVIENAYLNVSSSAMALFVTRALFFVGRDVLSRQALSRHCTGLVLCFIAGEMLLSGVACVSAVTSGLLVLAMGALTAMASFFWQPGKRVLP